MWRRWRKFRAAGNLTAQKWQTIKNKTMLQARRRKSRRWSHLARYCTVLDELCNVAMLVSLSNKRLQFELLITSLRCYDTCRQRINGPCLKVPRRWRVAPATPPLLRGLWSTPPTLDPHQSSAVTALSIVCISTRHGSVSDDADDILNNPWLRRLWSQTTTQWVPKRSL